MDKSDLLQRAERLAQSSQDHLSATIQEIVAESGEVAERVVHGRHNLSPSDMIVAASLAEMSEMLATAFVNLPDGKRAVISAAADRGDLRPLDRFTGAALREASPDDTHAMWREMQPDPEVPGIEAPAPEGDTLGSAFASGAKRSLKYGSVVMNGIALARFAGSLLDPGRSVVSKGLRVATVAAQMGWSNRLASGDAESLPADALVFADALLGPYALRASPGERLRAYWRQHAVGAMNTHLRPSPLRDFLAEIAAVAPLTVAEPRIADAKNLADALRRGETVSEPYALRVLPELYTELSFRSALLSGPDGCALARVVDVGLHKDVLKPTPDGCRITVRGTGVRRTIDVPDGEVRTGPGTYASLRALVQEAAASRPYARGECALVSVVLHTVSLAAA